MSSGPQVIHDMIIKRGRLKVDTTVSGQVKISDGPRRLILSEDNAIELSELLPAVIRWSGGEPGEL
jgi:hypothetical protein